MAKPSTPSHIEAPGPNEMRDPFVRQEIRKAGVWIGLAVAVFLIWELAQELLLIAGGVVLAAMLDGGTRLLGRILPINRQFRLLIITLAVVFFLAWVFVFAGSQFVQQAEQMRGIVEEQVIRIANWAKSQGLTTSTFDASSIAKDMTGAVGQLTSAVSSALGGVMSIAVMLVIGLFLAIEPRNYERGLAWMFPLQHREQFYETTSMMGATLRRLMAGRLLGMTIEGIGTWLLLMVGGVPMAGLLGLLTGILAFLPNIGAIISGVLMVLVGFSAGTHAGFWAMAVYAGVHLIDGWVVAPMVAKKSVDLAPALVLGAQLLFGALFGILGLALADPMVAMIKVALEKGSEESAERAEEALLKKKGKPA